MFKNLVPLALALSSILHAADIPGSKDPAGIKRYDGSAIIGYQAPKQDEYYYSTGKTRTVGKVNPFGAESVKLEGLLSRWTYLVPDTERSAYEVFTNYKKEFETLGLQIVYAPEPDSDGKYGSVYSTWQNQAKLGQILDYSEKDERYLVARSAGETPTYYVLFVTSFFRGIIPIPLRDTLRPKMPLVQLDIIAPASVEEKMALVKAEEMERKLDADGGIALYGILFDFNKDTLKPESAPTLGQIAELMKKQPDLKLYVVGHTDRVGALDFNQDLSQRRARSVVKELTVTYQISASRLASAGVAFLAPVATNSSEEGRAKNRRVVLIPQEK